MATNNLSRLLPSISSLSTNAAAASISVSRVLFSSSSTQQPQHRNQMNQENASRDEEDTVKPNFDNQNREEDSDDDDGHVNKETGEVGGPRGPEPTRFGDWERNGRCYDF